MFGDITIKKITAANNNDNLFLKKIFLISFSKNKKNIDIKIYAPAYLDKKAKPTNIPNKTKFILRQSFLICKIIRIDKDQKKTNITSVETIKEETVTAGIKKKVKDVIDAKVKLLFRFLEIKNTIQDVKQ